MRTIRGTRVLSATNLLCVVAGLLLVLVLAPSAWAVDSNITKDKASPVVGESITFTYTGASDCAATYAWSVDGQAQSAPSSVHLTTSFATAGTHVVTGTLTSSCGTNSGQLTFDVRPALVGSIAVSPDPPEPGQTATLSATQTGGFAPFTYAWDTDNDGAFDNGTTRTVTKVFTTAGPHVVRARIRDGAPDTHETIVTRTIDAEVPAPPAPGTPAPPAPPPPPPCVKTVAFQLSELTTDGCFTQTATEPSRRWETTAAVRLNGITFPDYGQTFTITEPTTSEPGGHFKAPDSAIQLGGFTAFSGDIDWPLPAGGQGNEKELRSFSVAAGAKIFALNVRGSIALRLGWGADGTHYATFPLTIELPAGFKAGPDPSLGRVTGSASLRVDVDGVHYDGLKLQASDVWLGKLKVVEACFSFVPAGGQSVAPCEAPSLDGKPYISCSDDVSADRWDGNAVIELPGGGGRLAAFGGLANGQVSKLGGFADNLGRRVPIAPNIYLNRVGVGLCLTPPPLTLRGDVGIAIFPTTGDSALATVNGHITYTDATQTSPWTLEIGGSVKIADTEVGSGSVTLRSYGGIDFSLQAGFNLYDVASLEGGVDGWVDSAKHQFNVSGFIKGCLGGEVCAKGSAVVSSTGVAGCIEVGRMSDDYIVIYTNPFRLKWITRTSVLYGGFGYRWGAGSVDLLGNSCNFSAYSATRSTARAAGSGISERIARGTKAVSLSIHGTQGPPKVVLRGPGGTTITSPASGIAKQSKGHYVLVENRTDGTTDVLLVHPAAGTWTVSGVPGAASSPTNVDRAKFESPPVFGATVRGTGQTRTLQAAYAVPAGASVRLVERAKGLTHTIAASVHGRRCASGPGKRPGSGQATLCALVRFRPARGPGGLRHIQAVVTRAGVPLLSKDIASFRAARETLPSRPGPLLARRGNGTITVAFPQSRGASRYLVTASLSDGRELSYDLGPKCQAVLIAKVPGAVAATFQVAGVRYDLAMGAKRSVSLKANVASAAPKGKLPLRLRRPSKVCS
jgi:hypothetical protein